MKYKITHTTRYNYDAPVPVCQNIVYLTPRSTDLQSCSRHRLTVKPHPTTSSRRTDYFGNGVTAFSIDTSHRVLQITASSTVLLGPRPELDAAATEPWEQVRAGLAVDRTPPGLGRYQFAFASPHVPLHNDLADYAARSFTADRPILEAVCDLTRRIHEDIKYDPKATTVSTPITQVFQQRRGVCQDMAHLMLGCLRSLGLPGRYVSGYLRTHPPEGKPRLVGADASHAWLAVFCGQAGWVDVDPTNNRLPSDEHITLAWGRDFGDVCPVAGMFTGGGSHQLQVSVDVAPVG